MNIGALTATLGIDTSPMEAAEARIKAFAQKTLNSLSVVAAAEKKMVNDVCNTMVASTSMASADILRVEQARSAKLREIHTQQSQVTEKSFQTLGIKSNAAYTQMRSDAVTAYAAIKNESTSSNEEIARAAMARTQRLKSITQEQYASEIKQSQDKKALLQTHRNEELQQVAKNKAVQDGYWDTLGIKSKATYAQMRQDIIHAATATQATVKKNSAEWVRIEKAKNAELKRLNSDMSNAHRTSMASMARAVLRLYAVYYVLSTAVRSVLSAMKKGYDVVEDYNTSIAELSAMVMSFSKSDPGETMAGHWERCYKYAKDLVPVLEDIAAKTILSQQETMALANAFARSKVFLDPNKAGQMEGFIRLSNALPMMTRGQEIMRQINTEIRSLMTGTDMAGSMLIKTFKEMEGFSVENLELWRQQGTVLEHIGELLVGFGPATSILEKQWTAVKNDLETIARRILRESMFGAYEDLISAGQRMSKFLKDNEDLLIGLGKDLSQIIADIPKAFAIAAESITKLIAKIVGSMEYMSAAVLGLTRAYYSDKARLLSLFGDEEGAEEAWTNAEAAFLGRQALLERASKNFSIGKDFKDPILVKLTEQAKTLREEIERINKTSLFGKQDGTANFSGQLKTKQNELAAVEKKIAEFNKPKEKKTLTSPPKPNFGNLGGDADANSDAIAKQVDKYAELIDQLQFEQSMLGKSEIMQRAMTLARQAEVKEGTAQFKNILSLVTAYENEKEAIEKKLKTKEALEKYIEIVTREQEAVGKTTAEIETMNFAREHGLVIGDKEYEQYLRYAKLREEIKESEKREKEYADVRTQFSQDFSKMGKSDFDVQRDDLEEQRKSWIAAGVEKNQIEQRYSYLSKKIAADEQEYKIGLYQSAAGQISDTFLQIAQAGGKQSVIAFRMYQAFAVAQAMMAASLAYTKALGDTTLIATGQNIAMANVVAGLAAVQIAMILGAQPPSYDSGGISHAKGVYQTGDIDEAHIPLKSGKVPVELSRDSENSGKERPSDIVNILTPQVLAAYLATPQGRRAQLNFIGANASSIKRALR